MRELAENLKFMSQTSMFVKVINVVPKTDFNEELAVYNGNSSWIPWLIMLLVEITSVHFIPILPWDNGNMTNAFIVITQCETIEVLIRHLRTLTYKPNIIFLDFFICRPLQKSEASHLEIFRLRVNLFT